MTSDFGALDRPRFCLADVFVRYRYAAAALDQMALSIFGFALNLVLLRTLSATDYGIVSLWMTMSLFAVSVQAALVPLNIYLPAAATPEEARRLTGALASVNLVAVLAAAALAGTVNLVAQGEWAAHDALTAVAIPLFVAAGMYREYYRSTAFSRRDMALLLRVDGPYLAVTTVCLGAMVLWPQRFADLATAFLAMTIGCLVSQLWVRLRTHDNADRGLFGKGWVRSYRSICGDIAWSLVGVVANHAENRSYVYIATSLAGMASLAAINAVGILFRPVSVLVNAWGQSALPQLSAALANNRRNEFTRMLGRALGATAIASVAIAVALRLAWTPIAHFLLADKYPDGIVLLWPWAVASAASVLRYVAGIGLMAAREFRFLATAQTVCGVLSAAATAAFILWHGYAAAMWGIALGNGACFVWALLRLRRVCRQVGTQVR